MAQTWNVGVLRKKIGLLEFGGDIAFELSFSFTAITYPVLRYIEKDISDGKRVIGRFNMDGVDRRAGWKGKDVGHVTLLFGVLFRHQHSHVHDVL